MKTLLLVDYNSLFRRALELSQVTLSWNDIPTNGVYGFIQQFCETVSAVEATRVIVCTDSRPYDRSKLFPEYKSKHIKSDIQHDIVKFNHSMVDEFINLLEIPYWKEKGLEADDLIAMCCNLYHNEFDRIVIASSDSDLFQLLEHPNVYLRRRIKKKNILYGREEFRKEYNYMSVEDYIRYLSTVGTHNAIPGIKGFGPVKAKEIVAYQTVWDAFYKEHRKELDLYLRLIRLPFRSNVKSFPKPIKGKFPKMKIIVSLAKSGISLTQSMEKALTRIGGNK